MFPVFMREDQPCGSGNGFSPTGLFRKMPIQDTRTLPDSQRIRLGTRVNRRATCERALYHRANTDITYQCKRRESHPRKVKTFGGRIVRYVLIGPGDAQVSCIVSLGIVSRGWTHIWIPAKALTLSNGIYARRGRFLTESPKTIFMQIGQ
jgi:hypothetical protein